MTYRKRPRSSQDQNLSSDDQDHIVPPSDIAERLEQLPSSPGIPFSEEEQLIPDDIDEIALAEDEDGEDLFGDGMENDYKENEKLDRYDDHDIDNEEYEELDAYERARIEREMRKRDVLEGRLPDAFLDDQEDYEEDLMKPRRRRRQFEAAAEDEEMEETDLLLENLHDLKGLSIPEWVAMDRPRNTVKKEFKNFLLSYVDEHGHSVYGERIKLMCEGNHTVHPSIYFRNVRL